jgi:hypothetical protein
MTDLRGTLDRIVAPPASPDFHDELAARILATELAARRRRRRASAVLAVVVLAATGAAGVFAFGRSGGKVVDQTYSCRSENVGGVNQFSALVVVNLRQVGFEAETGASAIITNVNKKRKNALLVDGTHCQQVNQSIPLARAGVPLKTRVRVSSGNPQVSDRFYCWVGRALFRVRVTFNSSGVATRTLVAIRNARTAKSIAFVQEVPPYYTLFSASACRH